MKTKAFSASTVSVSLLFVGGCGGDGAPNVGATMTAACIEARDIFAAASEPVDPATQAAFFEASDNAVRAATFPARDLTEKVEVTALEELHLQLDNFPRLVGFHEPVSVAFEARAAITRLDRFARDLGVPECGAATWRPDAWASLTDQAADRPTEERFTADVKALCSETFGGLPEGGTDRAASLLAGHAARQAVDAFKQDLLAMPPPRSMEAEYISLVAALLEFDAAVPDVAPTNPRPDFEERVDAATTSVLDALEDLRLAGGVAADDAWC